MMGNTYLEYWEKFWEKGDSTLDREIRDQIFGRKVCQGLD